MIFIAYLLSIILVPLLSAVGLLFTFPLLFIGAANFPRLVAIIQGVITGIVAAWCCRAIFSVCEVTFSNTPLWVMGFLFFLNDLNRLKRASSHLPSIGSVEMDEISLDNSKLDNRDRSALIEVGHLTGTPVGFLIWANWLT